MVKYVYTLSDVGSMFDWTFLSIQSLKQWVDKSDILVLYAPPINGKQVEVLEDLGVTVELVNETRSTSKLEDIENFGEITQICDVDSEDIVFLEYDTLVFGDITKVLSGDFDFKARANISKTKSPDWELLFDRHNETYMDWMPDTSFLVFKNGTHKQIGEKWNRYMQTDLSYEREDSYKKQYTLALSVSNFNVAKMSSDEHVMFSNSEYPIDSGVVYHIGDALQESETNRTGTNFSRLFRTLAGSFN